MKIGYSLYCIQRHVIIKVFESAQRNVLLTFTQYSRTTIITCSKRLQHTAITHDPSINLIAVPKSDFSKGEICWVWLECRHHIAWPLPLDSSRLLASGCYVYGETATCVYGQNWTRVCCMMMTRYSVAEDCQYCETSCPQHAQNIHRRFSRCSFCQKTSTGLSRFCTSRLIGAWKWRRRCCCENRQYACRCLYHTHPLGSWAWG